MTIHRLQSPPADSTQSRLWCDCSNVTLGQRWYPRDGTMAWEAWEAVALERARTGVLSARFKAHADYRKVGGASLVSPLGMMLVLLAHTHHRGQRLPADETVWDAAASLVALAGPVAGARLILEHTHTRT